MKTRLGLLLGCVVGGMLACWVGAPSVGLAAEPLVAGGPGGPDLGGSMVAAAVPVLTGGEGALEARAALLASPEEVVAREESQRKFEGLSASEAAQLVGEAFPGVVNVSGGGPPVLPSGQRITGFAAADVAQVDLGGGQGGVIESTAPMALASGNGSWSAIDLGLEENGGVFRPARPLVEVGIPQHLEAGVKLPELGLSLTAVNESGSIVPGEGVLDGAAVFYGDTGIDTDTVVKPTTFGFDDVAVLRSQASPQELRYRVGMPGGASLREDPSAGTVGVVDEGEIVAVIEAPTARDAAGTVVPVTMSVTGDVLNVQVPREPDEYRYPIAVDPEFNTVTETLTPANWQFVDKGGGYTGKETLSHELEIRHEGSFAAGDVAYYQLQTKGVSRIYETTIKGVLASFEGGGLYPPAGYFDGAIEIDNTGVEEHKTTLSQTLEPATAYVCAAAGCSSEGGSESNSTAFSLGTLESSEAYKRRSEEKKEVPFPLNFSGTMIESTAYISQPAGTHTTVTYNTKSPELEYESGGKKVKTPNIFYTYGWVGPKSPGAFEVEYYDAGLGVAGNSLSVYGTGKGEEHSYLKEAACKGIQCIATQHEVLTYATLEGHLYNGEDKITASGYDAAPHSSSSEFGEGEATLKVDKTAPHGIKLSGLSELHGEFVLREVGTHVKIEATDGEGTTPSSGVKFIDLFVDGKEVTPATAGWCRPGPCTATGQWTLNGAELGAGPHTLAVQVSDEANNVATENYSLYVYHAAPVTLGPGSVNPQSGDYALESSDVAVSGGSGSLVLTRHYDSRNTKEGEEGPLGPQWTVSLGSLASLEVLEDKSVMVIGSTGLTHFSLKEGKFQAPAGDTTLTLKPSENSKKEIEAYVLEDSASGTSTTFTLPVGAKRWMPTVTEGPATTDTTTDEYTTAEPEAGKKIVEPTLEVAPHPDAVCERKKLERGCRALEFVYAHETTASGENEKEWGKFNGRLEEVQFIAYSPASKKVQSTPVARYEYDKRGRLRAVWNPEVTPSKTIYGYDREGHVTAITSSGEETWTLHYGGTVAEPAGNGRLLSLARPSKSGTSIWDGSLPVDTAAPTLSTTNPLEGSTVSVAFNGTWSNNPVSYSYQWKSCWGKVCSTIPGATNSSFTPNSSYANQGLKVLVAATNAGGTVTAESAETGKITGIAPTYVSEFGKGTLSTKVTSESVLYAGAVADAVDASGNVWVANSSGGSSKVYVFSAAGALLHSYSVAGMATGIAINQSTGKVYVADGENQSIHELGAAGEALGTIHLELRGSGYKNGWVSVAVDSAGNIWTSNYLTGYVEEFSPAGICLLVIKVSEVEGLLEEHPVGIAVGNERVYTPIKRLGAGITKGWEYTNTGALFKELEFSPVGIDFAYEPDNGFLYTLKGTSAYEYWPTNIAKQSEESCGNCESAAITKFGSEKLGEALDIAVDPSAHYLYVVDHSKGEVEKWTAPKPEYSSPAPPPTEGNAIWTVDYNVPPQGAGEAPKLGVNPETQMSEPARWGQTDVPVEGTAIFPPDEPMGWPARDYKRATIYYTDAQSRTVNVASPLGGISTTEYNEEDEVRRTLSADNRASALKEECKSETECKSAEGANLLDTKSIYNSEGQLTDTRGPQHTVKLVAGKEGKSEEVLARNHVHYYYDEGAPGGETYNLVTKTVDGAETTNGEEFDKRTATTSYSGQKGLGWTLRAATSQTTDPAGLDLTSTIEYDKTSGNVTETKTPGGTSEAVEPPTPQSSFGSPGGGNGQFNKPTGAAVDASGNVWVIDSENDRVQKFTAEGIFIAAYGSKGTGNGQFTSPTGIAISQSTGDVYISDSGNNRIEELNSAGGFVRAFGSNGSGEGQFKSPAGLAIDGQGNVWVADEENNRVQEFSATGTYESTFGSSGSGNGQLAAPTAVALSEGQIFVVDHANHRVQEFSPTGAYLGQFGTNGSGPGQFREPYAIAVNPNSGELYVSDTNLERVEEYSPAGKYLDEFGAYGAGKGQFHGQIALATSTSGGLYASDATNDRVEQWQPPEAGGAHMVFSTQFGSAGSGSGQFNSPRQTAIDGSGNLWVLDYSNHRLQEFSAQGKPLAAYGSYGTGNGQFEEPTGIDINQSTGNLYVADCQQNRVQELSSSGSFIRAFGTAGTGNGQFSCPAGVKLDSAGDVWVADSGNDRVQEFSATGTFIAAYGSKGTGNLQFEEPWGLSFSGGNLYVADYTNQRIQELSGSGSYIRQWGTGGDGGGQFKGPETIATDSSGNLYVVDNGNDRVQEFSPAGAFLGAFASQGSGEGQLSDPQGIAVNAAGDVYLADSSNQRIQEWMPADQAAHDTKTIYYTAKEEAESSECQNHPEWVGLPCQSTPAAQPEGALPALPTKTIAYNMWDQPEIVSEKFGSTTRTTKTEFDGAGRPLSAEETSSNGVALPKVSSKYSTINGTLEVQSTTVGESTHTITTHYNKLGQLESYTDASGKTTSYAYDEDGRLTKINDASDEGKGEQTYTYDRTTGELTKLVDIGAGTFTASYDVQGLMTSESYPNGMTAYDTYNPVGQATTLEYRKLTHCTENCTWIKDSITPSIHGEALAQNSTLAAENYTYDAAGRLTQVQETPAGEGCTTRGYAYNEDGDRMSLTTSKPGGEGKCTTENPGVERHTYDPADRMSDEGITYEPFGDVTSMPAADAGGYPLTSEYYLDGQIYKQTQHAETSEYKLDPEDRTLETNMSGETSTSITSHYDAPGDAVAWTSETPSGAWERRIPGIDGTLAATQTTTAMSSVKLQLHDLQGNIIATVEDNDTATKLITTYNSTEFGAPNNKGTPPKYAWQGASGLTSESTTGRIVQDAITYLPQTGRPIQAPENLAPPQPNNQATPYTTLNYQSILGAETASAAQLAANREQENHEREQANHPPGDTPGAACNEEIEGCGPDPEHGENSAFCSVWVSWKHYLNNKLGVIGHAFCVRPEILEMQIALLIKLPDGQFANYEGSFKEVFPNAEENSWDQLSHTWVCAEGHTYQAWVFGRYWYAKGGTVWWATAEDGHTEGCSSLARDGDPTPGPNGDGTA